MSDDLATRRLTLVSAPGGSGKTTLARCWRDRLEAGSHGMAWITLCDFHAELQPFLEDLIASIRALRPCVSATASRGEAETGVLFGESIERLLLTKLGIDEGRTLKRLVLELRSLEAAPIVCLDAYEHLPAECPTARLVDGLLRHDPCPVHMVLTTRGRRPAAATSLIAAGEAIAIGAEDLDLRTAQIHDVLLDAGVEPVPELVASLLGRTRGWAMAVRLLTDALAGCPAAERIGMIRSLGLDRNLLEYIGTDVLGRASPSALEILETSARLGPAPEALLVAAADPSRDPALGFAEAVDAGLLILDGGRFEIHELWREWLLSPMRRTGEATVRLRIGRALESEGEVDRALEQYVEAGREPDADEAIVRLLESHGHGWLAEGRIPFVESALERLAPDRVERSPVLTALAGLVLAGRDPEQSLERLRDAARAYREAGQIQAEADCLHDLGLVAFNQNRADVLQEIRARMFAVLRSGESRSIRATATYALGVASLLSGRYSAAVRLLGAASAFEQPSREAVAIGVNRAEVHFFQGRWSETSRQIKLVLEKPEHRRAGFYYFALRIFQANIESGLDQDSAKQARRLEEACDFFGDCHFPHMRIRAGLALAHHLRRDGRLDSASTQAEHAFALARRIDLGEAVAASAGVLARIRWLAGDEAAAREWALEALRTLEPASAWQRMQRGKLHCFVPGILLACLVLAELDEQTDRVDAFMKRHRRRLELPALALCQHMFLLTRARLASRAEAGNDAGQLDMTLAWKALQRAGAEGFAPEVDSTLLADAVTRAKAAGLSTELLDSTAHRLGLPPSAKIAVRTLGAFEVVVHGRPITRRAWRGKTAQRLFVRLLVAEGSAVSRERLEASLWPGETGERARASLRTALLRLRDALEPRRRFRSGAPLVLADERQIELNTEILAAWDVMQWRAAIRRAREATAKERRIDATRAVDAAIRLDGGELMPGLDDEWVRSERTRIARERAEAGLTLGDIWLDRGETRLALDLARMVLRRDETDEACWALIVRARIRAGDLTGARRSLRDATEALAAIGATPAAELRALAQEF